MIDTNTVNFAMEKISSALSEVAPHIQNVSEEYIRYTVTKVIIGLPMVSIFLFGMLGSIWFFNKMRCKWGEGANIGLMFSIALSVCALVAVLGCAHNVILAITSPEMYTIHKLISSVR